MKTTNILKCSMLLPLILAFAATPAAAQVEIGDIGGLQLSLGIHTVGTAQALDHDNAFDRDGNLLGDLEPGFQTAWGNLEVWGTFGEEQEIEMFFDLYIASRPHPSETYGHEGYLLVRGVPENLKRLQALDRIFDVITFKVGHFEIDFGDHRFRRSDNADAQNNALVGNFIIDPEMVEVGAEIFSKPGTFNWLIGISSGTNTEDFTAGRGTALHGKLWLELPADVRLAGSYYTVDHSDNGTGFPTGGSKTNLFSGNRGGGRYGGVLGGGQAPGQVFPQKGQDMTAWQTDLTWSGDPLEIYAHYGRTEDVDINGSAEGSPEESWDYWSGELVYHFTDNCYAAARLGGAAADRLNGLPSAGTVTRLQAGFGYRFTDQLLLKVEYVQQEYDDFADGDVVSGVQAWQNPEFSGVITEVSFSF